MAAGWPLKNRMNPYEVTTRNALVKPRVENLSPVRWFAFHGSVVVAGLVGYFAPIICLGLLSGLTYGWPAAMDNLERIATMHSQLNTNFCATFTPNVVLAIIAIVAASKSGRAQGSQKKWWIVAGITFISIVVVSFVTAYWNLIPWTWSSELSNTIRSALTLILPLIVYVGLSTFSSERSNATTRPTTG